MQTPDNLLSRPRHVPFGPSRATQRLTAQRRDRQPYFLLIRESIPCWGGFLDPSNAVSALAACVGETDPPVRRVTRPVKAISVRFALRRVLFPFPTSGPALFGLCTFRVTRSTHEPSSARRILSPRSTCTAESSRRSINRLIVRVETRRDEHGFGLESVDLWQNLLRECRTVVLVRCSGRHGTV